MSKIIVILTLIMCTSCAMMPDKLQTKYKTDDKFIGTGYEFSLDWELK